MLGRRNHGISATIAGDSLHRKRSATGSKFGHLSSQKAGCKHCELPGLLQESLGPFGPEVSQECPRECPRKRGVRASVRRGVSGSLWPRLWIVQKVSRECPRSVKQVSRTLRGHSRDTFWTIQSPGPKGNRRHPVGHSLGHPRFSGTLSGALLRHFGPEGPKRLL